MGTRLLLDESLSERLLEPLLDQFPGSVHIRHLTEAAPTDQAVWELARAGGFVLVTRDRDFARLSDQHGGSPKVIWLNIGTASSPAIASFLLRAQLDLARNGR